MNDDIDDLKRQLADANERAAQWEKLHTEATITRELTRAAEEGGAFNPDQVIPYLRPAKLVEINGQRLVRVITKDDDGKEVHHTPAQAVARLRQIKNMGNFFKDILAGQPTLAPPTTAEKIDLRKMTPQLYREIMATRPELLGSKPKGR